MASILPENYQKPVTGNSYYFKPSAGDSRVRIVGSAITGYLGWDKRDDKPVPRRAKEYKDVAQFGTSQDKVKHFWALPVLDRADGRVKIWEITQGTIQDALHGLDTSPDWGDMSTYDITVHKEGQMLDTKYTVMPCPKAPVQLDANQQAAVDGIDLAALYRNDDPFRGVQQETVEVSDEPPQPVAAAATADDDDVPF